MWDNIRNRSGSKGFGMALWRRVPSVLRIPLFLFLPYVMVAGIVSI